MMNESNARFKQIFKITLLPVILLGVIFTVAACGSSEAVTPIKATEIEPQVAGDTISISAGGVTDNQIVHFKAALAQGDKLTFMAYELDGKINVMANVCPPCRSVGFSLFKDTLVCDTCGTKFNAATGEGISGACVDYPKAAVTYQINGDNIVMKGNDLKAAYQNTIQPGRP